MEQRRENSQSGERMRLEKQLELTDHQLCSQRRNHHLFYFPPRAATKSHCSWTNLEQRGKQLAVGGLQRLLCLFAFFCLSFKMKENVANTCDFQPTAPLGAPFFCFLFFSRVCHTARDKARQSQPTCFISISKDTYCTAKRLKVRHRRNY